MRIATFFPAILALALWLAPRPGAASPGTEPPPAAAGEDDEADEADLAESDDAPMVIPTPAPGATMARAEGETVLFHWPIGEARPGRRGLTLSARWIGEWNGKALRLHWRRVPAGGVWKTADFHPDPQGLWEVRIPSGDLKGPTLAYWIESVEADGTSRARFGSAGRPQEVRVATDPREDRVKDRLAGHRGHRHRAEASFHHVDFGRQFAATDRQTDDYFHEFRLAYTYRPLAAGLYHVQVGLDLVGDRLGVRTVHPPDSGAPGAYLGFVKLYWEFSDVFGLEPAFFFGASHAGVEAGGGIAFRFGALRGTHFDLSFSGVRTLGWRFETELDVLAAKFLRIALRNEITTWPVDAEYGVIPAVRLTFLLPKGIELMGQVGYGIRKGYDRGWVSGFGGLAFEF